MSLIIPRGTTGAAVASQATENSSVQSTDEVWSNLTVPVVTIAGQQDVSRQSLERGIPGLDGLIYTDLAGAYAAELDRQVLHGTGASGQALGITQTSSIYAATAFGAAVSATNFTLKVAGAVAGIAGAGTAIQPRVIVMHPRRWGWLQSLVDSGGRPPRARAAGRPVQRGRVHHQPGRLLGRRCLHRIPGTGSRRVGEWPAGHHRRERHHHRGHDQRGFGDRVRQLPALLWEESQAPRQLRFEQTLGNQLTVKVVAYGYAAFTAGRYPGAFGKIGGLDTTTNGLIAPSF